MLSKRIPQVVLDAKFWLSTVINIMLISDPSKLNRLLNNKLLIWWFNRKLYDIKVNINCQCTKLSLCASSPFFQYAKM